MLLLSMMESTLAVAMVIATCLVVVQAQEHEEEHEEKASTAILDIDFSTWHQSYNENQKLLVLFYQSDKCDRCPAVLDILTQIRGHPEFPSDVKIVKAFSADLLTKVGIEQFPSLVYLRDKSHVIYDGSYEMQDLLEWLRLASDKITQRLDDESFDRLIEEATGNITGTWLIAFYKEPCKNVLPALETFGVRVLGQVNVAKVLIPESPRLTNRFNVTNCPEVVFLKDGLVYKYHLPTLDAASFKDFVQTSHKEFQGQTLPEETPGFVFATGNFMDFIKIYSQDVTSTVLVGVCGLVASLLLIIIFCCCRRSGTKRPKKAKKE